jgi:chromosome segregation ATPase
MNEEMKQFADLILKSLEAMEERINVEVREIKTDIQEIKTDIKEIKSNIDILLDSTERAAIKLSAIDCKINKHEDELKVLAFAHLRLVK